MALAYIPPYPERPERTLSPLRMILTARRNLIAIWPAHTFDRPFIKHKLLRRNVLVVNSPEMVREAFIDKAAVFERKSAQQRFALEPLIGDGLFISDGETWRRRRKPVAQITHVSRLAALAPAMSEGAGRWLARWNAKPAGTEIDALSEMAELTAGIICASIFGQSLGAAAAETVVDAFSDYQRLIGQMDILSLLGAPDSFPRYQGWRVTRAARRIQRVLDDLIAQSLDAAHAGDASLVRALSQSAREDGEGLDHAAIRNEASVLFMAGHETTANTLAWAWLMLSQDPATEARLHAEVDAVLGDAPATFEDVKRLPFTRAVVEETLRLYPPVPLQVREALADDTIGGQAVRRGDLILLNAWLLHRHRRLWDQPDAFLPDRFMPGGSGTPSRYAYVPFSIGPRICTGAAFGLTEAVICLATLARHTRLTLRPGWVVEPTCRLSLRPAGGLPMRIEKRG